MDSLFDKYRNEELTGADLQKLRDMLDTLDDDKVAKILDEYDRADRGTIDSFRLPDDTIERIRRKCYKKTGINRPDKAPRWAIRALWAAAVIVPLLFLSTVYLFVESRGYKDMAETDIAIMTGEGERVTTRLPDGTCVELNYLSELRYTLSAFNGEQRHVTFSGEGFFDVVKNDNAPFTISARELEIVVRGTVFNLQARTDEDYAELYLEKGCVDLKSRKQAVKLNSGQMALLNYATGRIEVSHVGQSAPLSWRTGDLLFHNEPLDKVIRTLSANYNYTIELNSADSNLASRFTGRIPSDNINEALSILEYTYHIKARINGRTITLTIPD